MTSERFQSYAEFWPYYLTEHSKRWTRRVHVFGTTVGLSLAISCMASGRYEWIVPAGLVPGYACAWLSHFLIEKNRPATFKYPWWSFISDFRMAYWWYTGKLPR